MKNSQMNQESNYLPVNKIKLICINLLASNYSHRYIAKLANVSPTTVNRIYEKCLALKITDSKVINNMSPREVYDTFYLKESKQRPGSTDKLIPNYSEEVGTMIEKKINIKERYAEYKEEAITQGKKPLSISYYSAQIKREKDSIDANDPDYYYAQDFPYGVYCEADFTGDKYAVNTYNGIIYCYIHVVCFPASYWCYAEFVSRQSTEESCRVMSDLCIYLGNRHPCIIVIDNALCWVMKHRRHAEAIINPSFANHMQGLGICVEAAPPYAPKRKSAAEHAVNMTQRHLSSFKDEFSKNQRTLAEHNKRLQEIINEHINRGPFRNSTTKTREFLFRTYELPKLASCQKIPVYEGDSLRPQKVKPSYHVIVNEHEYSVPYLYISKYVDIFVSVDYVIIKYEGKELARHLRHDGPGKTTVDSHKPELHQKIDRQNRIYNTPEDALNISKSLNDGLHRFCESKVKIDRENGVSEKNTIKTCRAVINAYKRSVYKNLYAEACIRVLNLPSFKWNSYVVQDTYTEIITEVKKSGSMQHQTELFIPNADEAHLRNYEENAEYEELD